MLVRFLISPLSLSLIRLGIHFISLKHTKAEGVLAARRAFAPHVVLCEMFYVYRQIDSGVGV